jgi:hypothetical protein
MNRIMFIVLLVIPSLLWPAIVRIDSYITPSGKELVILGDHHSHELDAECGKAHQYIFHCFINLLKPHVIIESCMDNIKKINMNNNVNVKKNIHLLMEPNIIDKIAHKLWQLYPEDHLTIEDQRNNKDQLFANLIVIIELIFKQNISLEKYAQHYALNSPLTFDQINELFSSESEILKNQINKLKNAKKIPLLLCEELNNNYSRDLKETNKLLNKIFHEQSEKRIDLAYIKYIQDSFKGNISGVGREQHILLKPGFTFAEIGFIKEIIEAQNKNLTLCYVGEIHAKNLESYLTMLGYRKIKTASSNITEIIKIINPSLYVDLMKNDQSAYEQWDASTLSKKLFDSCKQGKLFMNAPKTLGSILVKNGFEQIKIKNPYK